VLLKPFYVKKRINLKHFNGDKTKKLGVSGMGLDIYLNTWLVSFLLLCYLQYFLLLPVSGVDNQGICQLGSDV